MTNGETHSSFVIRFFSGLFAGRSLFEIFNDFQHSISPDHGIVHDELERRSVFQNNRARDQPLNALPMLGQQAQTALLLVLLGLMSGDVAYAQRSGKAPRKSESRAAGLVDEADKMAEDKTWPEAIDAYKLAIRLDPTYAPAYGGLGDAYFNGGNWDQALVAYKEQVRLAPNDAQAQYDLGYFYNAAGRHGEAFAPLVKATSLDPTFAEAFYGIGYAYLRGADFEKSISFLKSAIRLKPTNEVSHFLLATAYGQAGDPAGQEKEMTLYHQYHLHPYTAGTRGEFQLPAGLASPEVTPQALDPNAQKQP